MRSLAESLAAADMADIAAYFAAALGPPGYAPEFGVSGQWASAREPWWGLYVTQYAGRSALAGAWLTFDGSGNAVWLYFHGSGAWTAPGVYEAILFRNSGPPFGASPESGAGAPNAARAGSIAFVFTDGNTAEVTFTVGGDRTVHRIGRVSLAP